MGECFLHSQGGSGENKKIKGWKTGSTARFTVPAATEATYVTSIEAEREIATFQMLANYQTSNFFVDFANGYYLGGLSDDSSDAADVTRSAINSESGMVAFRHDYYAGTNYYYYVKRNNEDKKKLDIYATARGKTTTSISYEISYY